MMAVKPKIMVVFGTRPEAIKLLPLVEALKAHDTLDLRVCVTAQHRAMLDQILAIGGVKPDIDLDIMREGQTLDDLVSRLVPALGEVMDAERPDYVVVQGDTMTAMTACLAAHYRRIAVAHVEAGLRSGDLRHPWPEEANRRIISCIADMHFAPTQAAAAALRAENVDPTRIHMTGNTVIDAVLTMKGRIDAQPALAAGLDEIATRFAGRRIVVATCHRRENFGAGLRAVMSAIRDIASRPDVAIVFPMHPNPEVRRVTSDAFAGTPNVALMEPLDYPHFVRLLDMCAFILTDSGGIQEEAPALGKPVLILRETTERPEAVTAGVARIVGTDRSRIVAEATRLLDDEGAYRAMAHVRSPFGDGSSAQRIALLIAASVRKRV